MRCNRSGHIIFGLFLQELNDRAFTFASDRPVGSTNLEYGFGNTKDYLCDRMELKGVNVLLVSLRQS